MITFQYQNLAITLRSPDLQNTQDMVIGVQRKLDMLGRQHTWIPKNRTSRVHTLNFKALPREKLIELREFIINSAGKVVTYTDFNNVIWTGRITSENIVRVANGDCKESIALEFEGSKLQ